MPPSRVKGVFAINLIVARYSSDIEKIKARYMKSFEKFVINVCPNDLVILTRTSAGGSGCLKLHEFYSIPKAVHTGP